MAKSLYINLEDDVAKVINRLKRERSSEAVLVFPKRSFIFADNINLRLLKKQVDMLGKKVSILTMDERGQRYALEAGFEIKNLPRSSRTQSFSDIRPRTAPIPETVAATPVVEAPVEAPSPEPVPESAIAPSVPRTTITRKKKIRRAVPGLSRASARNGNRISAISGAPASVRSFATSPVRTNDNMFMPVSSKAERAPRRRTYRSYVVGFVALALIIVLLLVLVVLPSANIVVFAKTQSVARDVEIIADTKVQNADSAKLTVPAVAVNESHTIADNFQTNGKKEVGSRAEGRVAIYNLSGSPLALKASTTTLTVGNKSYVFKEDQGNIRPIASAGNDSDATVADIVAVEGGEAFNVPAGTRVEITNQAFGSQPQRLYAKTVSQIVGGTSRFVSVISKDDLTEAQSKLTKRVVDGINSNLADSKARLVDGAYLVNVESFTPDKPEGTEAQGFRVEMRVAISGLAFDENGLKTMIRQRLLSSLGSGRSLQDLEKDTVIYKIKNLDVQSGIMQLSSHYESSAKPNIQPGELANKLAGKSKEEASELILSNPDVEKVEITVQPSWQSDLPRFSNKIRLQIQE